MTRLIGLNRPLSRRLVLATWLIGLVLCAVVVGRTTFTTDLSAFLPQSPTREQRVLLDQLQEGVVSRLILVGIEAADAPTRAAMSKEVARRLRTDPAFATINNGEPVNDARDQAFFFDNRYLLSPTVAPERFTVEGLQNAINESIDLLASPAGMFAKQLLPRDPTGELLQLLGAMTNRKGPQMLYGAWASRGGERALILAQTSAAGSDIDAQESAIQNIQRAFDEARQQLGAVAAGARLIKTGPGVFAVASRETIKNEVTRLSILGSLIIICLLLAVYRSLTALALGLLPVLSGALVGVVAVSLGFGLVHGITLGFGTTLIGEAVDYSIYLFIQSRQPGTGDTVGDVASDTAGGWNKDFWPTIRLGVLTSVVGFSSLLLSSFPGLAQLGLYSISGLVVAAVVTRFVLPLLLPANFAVRDISAIGTYLVRIVRHGPRLRWPLAALALAAVVVVIQHRATLLDPQLSSLSPVAVADQQIDAMLRADMGAPDARYMVVVSASDREATLQAAERVSQQLTQLVDQGVLAAFDSPTRYLPSMATQHLRQASLPAADLRARLEVATAGLPLRATILEPFIADVVAAKSRALLQRVDLDNTSLALAVDAMLFQRGDRWSAMLPLTAPSLTSSSNATQGVLATARIQAALAAAGQPDTLFVDLKAETDRLYTGYLNEAVMLSLGGLVGIIVLLLLNLRSPAKVLRVLLPLVAAVLIVVAMLALAGHRMTILHLVGLLLIFAVGSNYALFFAGTGQQMMKPETLASLLLANLATVAGFGILGFAQVPVLQAIGITVGPGAVLALIFAACFADAGNSTAADAGSDTALKL
ncbi:MAG: MMPL family transporter [Pseudomonadota bacterium]